MFSIQWTQYLLFAGLMLVMPIALNADGEPMAFTQVVSEGLSPADRSFFQQLPAADRQALARGYHQNPKAGMQRLNEAIQNQRMSQGGVQWAKNQSTSAGTMTFAQQYTQAQNQRNQQRLARIRQQQQGGPAKTAPPKPAHHPAANKPVNKTK